MVHKGMKSDLIIPTILTSPCNFDVFPPVLDDLKRRGVPENVLQVMSVVPSGPPNLPEAGPISASIVKTVKLQPGAAVIVETLYPISSADFKVNNTIAFSVAKPVIIDDALIIPRGTIARARIVRVRKAGNFGRAGALTFEMERSGRGWKSHWDDGSGRGGYDGADLSLHGAGGDCLGLQEG